MVRGRTGDYCMGSYDLVQFLATNSVAYLMALFRQWCTNAPTRIYPRLHPTECRPFQSTLVSWIPSAFCGQGISLVAHRSMFPLVPLWWPLGWLNCDKLKSQNFKIRSISIFFLLGLMSDQTTGIFWSPLNLSSTVLGLHSLSQHMPVPFALTQL